MRHSGWGGIDWKLDFKIRSVSISHVSESFLTF